MRRGVHEARDVAAVELDQVGKSYMGGLLSPRKPVLTELSLSISSGSHVGLIGPNGSGKSTLQRLFAGAEKPTRGEVKIFGRAHGAEARARIGFLPEDSPFPADLSARAALSLLGSLQAMPRKELRSRSAELLELVGLAEVALTPLGRFSRGMLRRFGLAQAWLHEPDLLLLDEPTAGLDAPGFEVLDLLLAEARARGATVVISSHLISDLHERCDELILLSGGRVAARGTTAELLARPGCWRVEVEDLQEPQLDQLNEWITGQGGRVTECVPSGRTLFELYREALES